MRHLRNIFTHETELDGLRLAFGIELIDYGQAMFENIDTGQRGVTHRSLVRSKAIPGTRPIEKWIEIDADVLIADPRARWFATVVAIRNASAEVCAAWFAQASRE